MSFYVRGGWVVERTTAIRALSDCWDSFLIPTYAGFHAPPPASSLLHLFAGARFQQTDAPLCAVLVLEQAGYQVFSISGSIRPRILGKTWSVPISHESRFVLGALTKEGSKVSEAFENGRNRYQCIVFAREMSGDTRPPPVLCLLHKLGSHGIERHVAHRMEQMHFVHRHRSEAPLP